MKRLLQDDIDFVLTALKKIFPEPGAMEIGGAYHAVVAVALSARTRDEQVLKLLPGFFRAFPDVETLSKADEQFICSKINTIGMYRQKAKNLKKMALRVVEVFDGKIPGTMEELTSLAGVGRKTASVILPYIYGVPAIAVDTHVHRVTNRLGWVKAATPAATEKKLLKIIPLEQMKRVNEVFVKHGRYLCISAPRCWACPLVDVCAFPKKNLIAPKNAEAILADVERREAELQRLRRAVSDEIY